MFPNLVRDFSSHWKALNATLPPDDPLRVLENLPVSTLETLGEELAEAEAGHGPLQIESRLVRAAAQEAKLPLTNVAKGFNVWMRGTYPTRPETRLLAAVVGPGEAADKVRAMARRTLCLWRRIAAQPPEPHAGPPVLVTGHGVAEYAAALEDFEAAVDALVDAQVDEALLLARAVVLREEIVAMATAYGHAVRGRLREGDPRRASLPELWHPGGRASPGVRALP